MQFLTKFDPNGRRITSYPMDSEMTDEKRDELIRDGFIEITEEDWNYYIGNMGDGDNGTGYIRDNETGKPVSAPPHTPTKEERIAALDLQYEADKKQLINDYSDAMLNDDMETVIVIKADMSALNAQYDEDYRAIEEG